jgi:hypothetical protein
MADPDATATSAEASRNFPVIFIQNLLDVMTLTGQCLKGDFAPSADPMISLGFPSFERGRCIPASLRPAGQIKARILPRQRHISAAGRPIKLAES